MLDWIKTVIQSIGYPGIAFLMIVENIFPPIPSEIIMPFAGFVTEQGELNFYGVVAAGTFGSVVGTLPFYYLGHKIGEDRLKRWADKHGKWLMLSSSDIERAQGWFDRHDAAAVFFCRLIPGIRTLISVPAGIKKMNLGYFLILSVSGTLIWVGLLTYLGSILGQNYDKVSEYLDPVSYAVFGFIILSYIIHIIRHK
ncbi:DedA family protein [Rhodohalobacter sp. 614A]|uniref:DedA family protein n=1 Tax=Rhodohalobacter sp. 614A TaxID=2908649 RepID=UPI001F3C733E|nr:DedA family protein [Rhodohalobacter sp. 614A]